MNVTHPQDTSWRTVPSLCIQSVNMFRLLTTVRFHGICLWNKQILTWWSSRTSLHSRRFIFLYQLPEKMLTVSSCSDQGPTLSRCRIRPRLLPCCVGQAIVLPPRTAEPGPVPTLLVLLTVLNQPPGLCQLKEKPRTDTCLGLVCFVFPTPCIVCSCSSCPVNSFVLCPLTFLTED